MESQGAIKKVSRIALKLKKQRENEKKAQEELDRANTTRARTDSDIDEFNKQLREATKIRRKLWRASRAEDLKNQSKKDAEKVRILFANQSAKEDRNYREDRMRLKESKKLSIQEKVDKELERTREDRRRAVEGEIEAEEIRDAALMMEAERHREAYETAILKLIKEREDRLKDETKDFAQDPHQKHKIEPETAMSTSPTSSTIEFQKPVKIEEPPKNIATTEEIQWSDIIYKGLSENDILIISGEKRPENLGEYALFRKY